MTYPRIATCRVTGVKTVVESAEEEGEFHRAILPIMAIGFGLLALGIVFVVGLLIWTAW